VIPDPERQVGDSVRMVGPGCGHAADDHVRAAHCLHLLQPELGDEPVEPREEFVQEVHQLGW